MADEFDKLESISMDDFKDLMHNIISDEHPEMNEPLVFTPEPTDPAKVKDEPWDPGCGRYASDIPGVAQFAEDAGLSPAAYVRREEGTYSSESNHFLCDMCYIRAGQPSSPSGWKCP